MRRIQRTVFAVMATLMLGHWMPCPTYAQISSTGSFADIQPLLPPGISDFDIALYGRLATTWTEPDGTRVVEIQGNFSGRLGQYKLSSRDAVVWFTNRTWEDRSYLDVEVFLWQGAEIIQPAGTIETGPALLVTLRSFGKLILNADSHAPVSDADSDLFREGTRARGLLEFAPSKKAEDAERPLEVAPTVEALLISRPKVPKQVHFSAEKLFHEQHDGQSVIIAVDGVFVSQGSPSKSGEYLELRADAAVLYLNPQRTGEALPGLLGNAEQGSRKRKKNSDADVVDDLEKIPESAPGAPPTLDDARSDRQALEEWVTAVYLRGDVVLTRGERMIRASELYYDFENDKAQILDVVMRVLEPSRRLPVYVRAEEVRQLSATEYEARKAQFTTSEFHTPHVAIGADRVYLDDRTPRDSQGEVIGVEAGTYKAYHTTLNLEGIPVAYWPFSRGDFSRDRMAFRGAKFGYNSDFGATMETRWYLFNLLGLEQPEGFDATLKVDYFTDRGPAFGVDLDYEREDYFGLVRTYYLHDSGEDDFGDYRGGEPTTNDRGRGLWRHRQFLPKGWELSIEAAYVSDNQYMESFERNEFENGKELENSLYLVKRDENWQFSTLANWRANEWDTMTEHGPDVRFSLIGEPLGDYATFYHDSLAGVVRRRVDNRWFKQGEGRHDNLGETGSVVRGDLREEMQFPLPGLGPLKLTPYVVARGTAWDDSPDFHRSHLHGGSVGGNARWLASYGIHGNMMFSRMYDDVESQVLDLHRLRHVVKADVSAWNSHTSLSPNRLSPFDTGVEDIDDFGGATVGLRQRFQTKRGGPGQWRTVDVATFDVEAGFFDNAREGDRTHGDYIFSRPEESLSSNFLATNFQYRISDTTVFVHDSVFDLNRGNMGTSNVSIAVEREPRLAYFAGWRYIHDTDNNLLVFGANYKLNEKHTISFRELYDVGEGRNFSTEIIHIRRWPRWYTAVALDVDKSLDDIGINFSVWPEGTPRLGLGSKRYTGLADSVGLQLR